MSIFDFLTKKNKVKNEDKRHNSASKENFSESTEEERPTVNNSIDRYSPKSFDEVAGIIDRLMDGEAVIVDVSKLSDKTATRVIDLLTGAIYALDGKLGQLEKDLFVVTPGKAK
ncbi:MAG: cell division protein SepF [Clostridia bacterium]|nr:cell division protein SepF [Clostridia bacterium]